MDTNYSVRQTNPSHPSPAHGREATADASLGHSLALWTDTFDVDAANTSIALGGSAVAMTSPDKVFQHASVILLPEDHQGAHALRYLFRNLDTFRSFNKNDIVMMFESLPQGCSTAEILDNPSTPACLKSLIRDGFRVIGFETAVSPAAKFRWAALKQQICDARDPTLQQRSVASLSRELELDRDRFRAPNAKLELAAAATAVPNLPVGTLLGKADLGQVWRHLERAILHEVHIELDERMPANKHFAEQISAASTLYPHVVVQIGRNHAPDLVRDLPGVESLLNQEASRAGRLPAVSLYMLDNRQTFERRPHLTRCREHAEGKLKEVQRCSAGACLWLPGASFAEDGEFNNFFRPRSQSAAHQNALAAPAEGCVIL